MIARVAAAAALVVTAAGATAVAVGTTATTVDPKALPLGDGRIATAPKVGYVFSCQTTFGGIGGAQAIGPWIDEAGKTWDRTRKLSVQGAVKWPQARYTTKTTGTKRTFAFNDLPIGHATGTFPISGGDPASAGGLRAHASTSS